ncbi:MAG: DUF2958 domain-containing protein [Casimicrobiaceae bacterium]
MKLITNEQRGNLLNNGADTARGDQRDPRPVVKLFTPDANATWLLTELDPADPDLAFGLCDLGLGSPELGYVRLSELSALRGPLGLSVERDRYFVAGRPLSAYANEAQAAGAIRA